MKNKKKNTGWKILRLFLGAIMGSFSTQLWLYCKDTSQWGLFYLAIIIIAIGVTIIIQTWDLL